MFCELKNISFRQYKILFLAICVVTVFLTFLVKFQDPRPPLPARYTCQPNETDITTPLQVNMAIVSKYRFPAVIAKYRKRLGLNEKVGPVERDSPVIATGCSEDHFGEAWQMLENLQEKLFDSYADIQVYFYDLGLNEEQQQKIEKFPRVHLRTFPFSDYPDHVAMLAGYTWKPILMQILLREFGFVLWVDASVRLIYPRIEGIIQIARENGIAFRHGKRMLVKQTDIDTFRFLHENPCNFRPYGEIEANFMMLYRTQFINDYFMNPVVSCALSYGCMVPNKSLAIKHCIYADLPDHGCHRFDQSVFAIVLRRLFQNDNKYWVPPGSGIYLCRGPSKYVSFLPQFINNQYANLILLFDESNHARCRDGTRWYKPGLGDD